MNARALIAMTLAVMAAPAHSFLSGKEILHHCGRAMEIATSDKSEMAQYDDFPHGAAFGTCVGFLEGYRAAIKYVGSDTVCIPEDLSPHEMAQDLLPELIQVDPEHLVTDAGGHAYIAFAKAYPCE